MENLGKGLLRKETRVCAYLYAPGRHSHSRSGFNDPKALAEIHEKKTSQVSQRRSDNGEQRASHPRRS